MVGFWQSRGDWLWEPANIKVENNDAVFHVGSSLTVYNPLFFRCFYRTVNSKWRNALERCARSSPKQVTKTYTKQSNGFNNHSTLITMIVLFDLKDRVCMIFQNYYLKWFRARKSYWTLIKQAPLRRTCLFLSRDFCSPLKSQPFLNTDSFKFGCVQGFVEIQPLKTANGASHVDRIAILGHKQCKQFIALL